VNHPRQAIGLVDDDETVLRAIGRLLRACGYDVRGFSSAQAFLDQGPAIDEQLACLVVDVHMPGRSGLELRSDLDQAGRAIPMVLVTGAADAKLKARAIAEGAVALLQKPFTEVELLRAIELAFMRRQKAEGTRQK
jgi:FixJ family two-component response regulator